MLPVDYTLNMRVRKSGVYSKWIDSLKDKQAIYRINARISRLENGNPGDCYPIGEGLSEMRIHFGPGYRVYFKDTGREIIILLCGGDKSTQENDIVRAKHLASLPLEELKLEG